MNNVYLALEGVWRVLLASLLLGAGLPNVFAMGVRALAYGKGGDAEISQERPHPVGTVLAGVCFLIVIVAIGLGITYIVAFGFGYDVSFEHTTPTLTRKG